jgi:hypothetical protein
MSSCSDGMRVLADACHDLFEQPLRDLGRKLAPRHRCERQWSGGLGRFPNGISTHGLISSEA